MYAGSGAYLCSSHPPPMPRLLLPADQLRSISRSLSSTATLVHAFVTARLGYWSTFYTGLPAVCIGCLDCASNVTLYSWTPNRLFFVHGCLVGLFVETLQVGGKGACVLAGVTKQTIPPHSRSRGDTLFLSSSIPHLVKSQPMDKKL